jgi:Zn-dependent M28 family amino/carboxypeptidase
MNKPKLILLILSLGGLLSCSEDSNREYHPMADEGIIKSHLKTLSSDEFLGRMPFTAGEEKTLDYLVSEFEKAGAKPGNNGSWFQEVPMVEINSTLAGNMGIEGGSEDFELQLASEYVALTRRVSDSISIENSPLVFAGYGIVAPEYEWNDYEGLDMEGKTVIVLVNDPGFGMGDTSFFKGNTMTYYGRWTYKYEEAARQGALGIFVVHKTIPAGYPWGVVENGWAGPQLYLESEDGNQGRAAAEGWISWDSFQKILKTSGTSPSIINEAKTNAFVAKELGMTCSFGMSNKMRHSKSQNVIAIVPGSESPEEVIIYSAHWDHLGVGKAIDGDSIYNGALDNASGTTCILELARMFANSPTPPKRSLVLLSVTAEEQGLLGSSYYSKNPIFSPENSVANINMDGLTMNGPMRDLTVIGFGQSDLDEYAERAAKKQDRYIIPDPDPGKGYFFRSDHFNFAKIGIPALYCEGGADHFEKGKEYAEEQKMDYLINRYHKPQDNYDPNADLRGLINDIMIFYMVGDELANSDAWPHWKEGSEFKAIRDGYMK